jgi:hypothetical protein
MMNRLCGFNFKLSVEIPIDLIGCIAHCNFSPLSEL